MEAKEKTIKIAGAGISGLTAAINLAKASFDVEVYDRAEDSGQRFSGDFQGIENWSCEQDALDLLREINIELNFDYHGVDKLSVWAPVGYHKDFKLPRPAYYLVRRGTEKGFLDQGLKEQAIASGAKIFYNHPAKPGQVDIVATGPVFNDPNIDGFVSGYIFSTDAEDSIIEIFDNQYAPDGYSYLFIHNGCGMVAACIFRNYKKLGEYREKTLELCKQHKKFSMENVKKFSGTGNFFLPRVPKDRKIYIGEAGGFQDYLFGFGMRYAMLSGYYAAKSIIDGKDFYQMCEKEIFPKMKASVVNRFIFRMLGNKGYKWFIKQYSKSDKDPIKFVRKEYNPLWIHKLLFPLAKIVLRKNIKDPRRI